MNTTNALKVTLLFTAALGAAACSRAEADPKRPDLPPRPDKRVQPLPDNLAAAEGQAKSALPRGVGLTGRTRAHRESALATTSSGRVAQVLFEAGDFVKAGQVLVRLDAELAKLQVAQAKAALQTVRTQAAGALRERKRLEKVGPEGAVPRADVDRAVTAQETTAAQVAQAEAALALAEKGLADTAIRAPFSGLILARNTDEGEWVNTMSNAVVGRLADIDPLEIALEAPEHLLMKIHEGDTMKVRFAATGQTVDAKVSRVVRAVDPRTRSFEVVAEVKNADRALAPGLFAEARLTEEGGK